MTFLRNWTALGATLGGFALIGFATTVPSALLIPVIIGCYALGIGAGVHWSRGVRKRVRQVNAASYYSGGRREVGAYRVVSETLRRLERLDGERALSPAEYEHRWAEIYESLDRLPFKTRVR